MQRGQASVEYAAVVLCVAVALAGALVVVDATGVAESVRRQMARALCVVGGGDCDRDRRPCVIAGRRQSTDAHLTVAILRLGHNRVLVRERRSDGTVSVSFVRSTSGGVGLEVGASGHVSLGRWTVGLGGQATAAVLARIGSGRTWELPDDRSADALIELLTRPVRPMSARAPSPRPSGPELPPVAQTFGDRGWSVALGGEASAGSLTAELGISSQDVSGASVDARTGQRTLYLRRRNELVGAVRAGGAGVGGEAQVGEEYVVTVDRAGRPLGLTVVTSGAYGVSADLPRTLQAVAGLLSAPTRGERAFVVETHLDLTTSADRALARDFLEQVRSPRPHLGRAVTVSRALAARLNEAGIIDARTYETTSSSYGAGGRASVGVALGGSLDHSTEASRLVAAATRGVDGEWVRRVDCLAAARV